MKLNDAQMLTKKLFLLLFVLSLVLMKQVRAQISPSYSVSKSEGCVPLIVDFENTTGEDTSTIEVNWNFGNGNQSVKKLFTQAVYNVPGTYNVVMTIEKNGILYSTSRVITVFDNPQPDFETDITSGCVPLTVQFLDKSIPTQNPITQWIWNFGNGQGSADQNPKNSYLSDSKNNVTLVVVDSKGCKNLIVKNDYIVATDQPVVDFQYSDTSTCTLPLNIRFTGIVNSKYTSTYQWDFGNGANSKQLNPTTKYTNAGVYMVRFQVENEYNCSNEIVKNIEVKEEPLLVTIDSTDKEGCAPFLYSFKSTSNRNIVSYNWTASNFLSSDPTGTILFDNPGIFIVRLIARDKSGCTKNVYDTITVHETPKADFSFSDSLSCSGPFPVQFNSMTNNAVSHFWSFGVGVPTSSLEDPLIVFNQEKSYSIRYIATNQYGCSDTITRKNLITIARPQVEILSSSDGGCIPFTTQISLLKIGAGEIKNVIWNYSNGVNYTGNNPPNLVMNTEGKVIVTATVEFEGNCPYQTVVKEISAGALNSFSANIKPTTVCVKEGVSGKITNPDPNTNYTWYYGDGGTSIGTTGAYEYTDVGKFQVYIVAEKNGCKDSIKIETITVVEPSANFSSSKICNDKNVLFQNKSVGQNYSRWEFGDGTTLVSNDKSLSYNYKDTGTYSVKLYVENYTTGCKDSIIRKIKISDDRESLGITEKKGCVPFTVKYALNHPDFRSYRWVFNGDTLVGNKVDYTYDTSGIFDVTLIATRKNGCVEKYHFDKINTVVDYTADFEFDPIGGCAPIEVNFYDKTISPYSTIIQKRWVLGSQGVSIEDQPKVIFNKNQNQNIRLITTDDVGCKDTVDKELQIYLPVADFKSEYKTVCTNTEFDFENISKGVNLTYEWTFGNQWSNSTEENPKILFDKEGNYNVKLVVTDANQCKDSITKSSYVKVENYKYDFEAAPRFKTCPELKTKFKVLPSNIDFKNLSWDFGDGNYSLDTLKEPENIFSTSGKFDVQLILEDYRGCKDTITKKDYIEVKGPRGEMTFDPVSGCFPLTVNFNAKFQDSKFNFWDFGDGNVWLDNSLQNQVSHIYSRPGISQPSLVLDDGFGCVVHIFSDTIVISGTEIEIDLSKKGVCSGEEVRFVDKSIVNPYAPIVKRNWDFGNGMTSSDSIVTQEYYVDSSQVFYVILNIETELGCKDVDTIPVQVYAYPKLLMEDDKIICKGDDIELKVSGSQYFDWEPKALIANPNNGTIRVSPKLDTWFRVTGYDTISCPSNDSVFVKVVESFEAYAGPDTTICLGDSLMLKTNVSEVNSNKFEYTWYLNNEQMSTQQQWVAFPEKESTYIVHIKNGSCKEKVIPVFVNVSPIPSVEAFSDATISLGQSISLTASSDQLVEYTWYPDSNISCLHCFNPVVNPKISTMYKVVGVNEYGCYDDAKVNILVKDFCSGTEFDIPNVFSPNSDGLNDEFKIHYERDLVQIENFRIYNRYGELIFESKDADIGWDGNFNGVPVNSGVYVYYFDADCYHGTKQLYKGNVTLLR